MAARRRIIVLGLATLWTTSAFETTIAAQSTWVVKNVTNNWQWFDDYLYGYAIYTVACPPGRECQVGMGVFAFGEPRGEKIGFRGLLEITVIGFGSIHIRITDGKGPAKAAMHLGSASPAIAITIPW